VWGSAVILRVQWEGDRVQGIELGELLLISLEIEHDMSICKE